MSQEKLLHFLKYCKKILKTFVKQLNFNKAAGSKSPNFVPKEGTAYEVFDFRYISKILIKLFRIIRRGYFLLFFLLWFTIYIIAHSGLATQ